MNIDMRLTYTDAIHQLTPEQCWTAWESGELTVYQVFEYQRRHGINFNNKGEYDHE